MDRTAIAIFALAAMLRFGLSTGFPGLSPLLVNRVEISTPVTGFKELQEGVFLYASGVSPFDGGVYHQAPVFLPLFAMLQRAELNTLLIDCSYVLADLLSGFALYRIALSATAISTTLYTSPRANFALSPRAVTTLFLFNPFTIILNLGKPTSIFTNCTTLWTIAFAASGNVAITAATLSLSAYLSPATILLFPPVLLLVHTQFSSHTGQRAEFLSFSAVFAASFSIGIALLCVISYFLMNSSWDFLSSTYGFQLLFTDLTPNMGLWWYFFIEMFDPFREFFLGVFWLHLASYVGGLTIKLRKQPLFVIISMIGASAIFKPYPSLGDVTLYLAVLPLYRHVFGLLRYGFIAAAALLYATFLGPAFYHLWIYAGSGNANFFYAITLVWSLGLSILVGDTLYAVLRDEFESERPEMKGKELRRI